MKRFGPVFLSLFLLGLMPLAAGAQTTPWSSVLSSARAANWAKAGVPGGIPSGSWTQCGSTIAAYGSASSPASPSTIQNAINSCGANQYVQLGAGSFYLSGSFYFKGRSNVAIRGMGANSTFIHFYGNAGVGGDNCFGLYATICVEGSDFNWNAGPSNGPVNWTAGYAQGTSVITLASAPNLAVGNAVILDQLDSTSDTGAILILGTTNMNTGLFSLAGNPGPYSTQGPGPVRPGREQAHVYTVIGCNGSTTVGTSCSGTNVAVTIDPPIEEENWSPSLSPQAWWATNPARYVGIEDLYIDGTNEGCTAGNGAGIGFFNALDSWTKGVEDFNECRDHTELEYSARITVRDGYMFLARYSTSTSYGFETFASSDNLFENNICQAIAACTILGSASDGNVIAYNFEINGYYADAGFVIPAMNMHNANNDYNLYEGNIGSKLDADIIHGSKQFDTFFRNRLSGTNPVCWQSGPGTSDYAAYSGATWGACTVGLGAISDYSNNRFYNIIGNVLGTTGITTTYKHVGGFGESNGAVLNIGVGDANTCGAIAGGCNALNEVPPDSAVPQTILLWGNCDDVNGFSSASCQFNSSDVPVTANLATSQQPFANSVPGGHTLPASFYYSSEPSWWPSSKPWPIIGPDVTGGNISGTGGLAYTNPAEDCYNSLSGSTANGSGGPFPFDANACYGSGSTGGGAPPTPPAPPTDLSAVVD
jgi:hypothetical protein